MASYLEDLTIRLAMGVASIPEAWRDKIAAYFLGKQNADGGFSGREGPSDLYYTGFALRSLAVLGQLYDEPAERAGLFLTARLSQQETIVDFLSLVYGASLLENAAGIDVYAEAAVGWPDSVSSELEKLRRDDGGYAKGEHGAASSTYHTFLVILCRELIDRPLPNPYAAVEFLMSQQAEYGGFHEIRASKRAGANPTAAAIGALRILDSLSDETKESTIDFLLEMETDEGGLRANTRIPFADLLSTFTCMLTLEDLDALHELDLPAIRRYVDSMATTDGGFRGTELDPENDIEYSFYGLGSLALLSGDDAQSADLL